MKKIKQYSTLEEEFVDKFCEIEEIQISQDSYQTFETIIVTGQSKKIIKWVKEKIDGQRK